MYLTRLIYASKVSDKFKIDEIGKILEVAKINNAQINVTGALIYNHKYFLQVLEGGRENVNKIYNKILTDPRHSDPIILSYENIHSRLFENWNMKIFLENSLNRSINLKYSSGEKFDPLNLSGVSAVKLLEEVSKITK